MSPKEREPNWELSLFVPGAEPEFHDETEIDPGPDATQHKFPSIVGLFRGREINIEAATVQSQWANTINGLLEAASGWASSESGPWRVEEVTVGLTLSGKGKLLFIAEAAAEGSIQVKLTRKDK